MSAESDPAPRPPSVDALARRLADAAPELPHAVLVDLARAAIADGDVPGAEARAVAAARTLLRPVINATGVLLHTNLGRAPVAHRQAAGYSNLELDLATGERGSRQAHAGALAARACGAEAAIVVNNCASAVLLALTALANGRPAVVSRGELVEIGGGFRVPEVMAASGAELVEVGTTNRTRPADYARAVEERDPAVIVKVHPSNYRITGFTEEASVEELRDLGPTVLADIGSGLLDATCPWLRGGPPPWLAGEPAARQTLDAGADLVMFSSDKLLGGPQAGILAGDAELVRRCARHPLARAVRPGGLVLAALQDLLLAYLRRDGGAIPFWAMATTPLAELTARAEALGVGTPVPTSSLVGGGALPGVELPSAGVAVTGDLTGALRHRPEPIVARVEGHGAAARTVCDLRTVRPDQDDLVAAALTEATARTTPDPDGAPS